MSIELVRQPHPMPAAPGAAATIILFATKECAVGSARYTPKGGSLGAQGLTGVEFTWVKNDQASAANGVRLYTFDKDGVVVEVDLKDDSNAATVGSGAATPIQIPVLAAGQEAHVFLEVSRYPRGVVVTYTSVGAPTVWDLMVQTYHNSWSVAK